MDIRYSYNLFVFFSLAFFCSSSHSQTPKQWERLGNNAMEDYDFAGASHYYHKALFLDSSNLSLQFKYGESLRRSNDYKMASLVYLQLTGADKELKFPESLFWLATMQKSLGDYDKAQENFKQFTKIVKDRSSWYSKKSKQEIKSCEFAKNLIRDTIDVKFFNSGKLVNSINSEISPVLCNDSLLYFSSMKNDMMEKNNKMKIYSASKIGNRWKVDSPLEFVINDTSFHTGNGAFSLDKKSFYFSRCTAGFKCAIYVSEWKNEKWENAVKLDYGINPDDYTSTQPMVAELEGDEVLLFVSDMPGGKGKLDIWTFNLSEVKNGKSNVRPKNFSKINSIDNEISPFFYAQDSILYFSSDWYFGLGGFDIFKAQYEQKSFLYPENLGYPFNTSANDIYFSFYPALNAGFVTSNRVGSFSDKAETCCNDIYEFNYGAEEIINESSDTVNTTGTDTGSTAVATRSEQKKYSSFEMLNKYLPVTLYFHNDEPDPKSRDSITTLNYLHTYENYYRMKSKYAGEYSKDFTGEDKGKAISDIETFFSDYASKGISDLELFTELLIRELEKGNKIELTVKGYASPLAKTDYNIRLTLRRIYSFRNYIKHALEGAFLPFLNHASSGGGVLEIVQIPFGEFKADTTVSDNLNDQKNSVYSPKAAMERKIEIISVSEILSK